jgi:hypothetical protein
MSSSNHCRVVRSTTAPRPRPVRPRKPTAQPGSARLVLIVFSDSNVCQAPGERERQSTRVTESSFMLCYACGFLADRQLSVRHWSRTRARWCGFDSDPMFSALLDEQEGGRFLVGAEDGKPGVMAYEDNTNILVTTFRSATGAFRVIDFAPRFCNTTESFTRRSSTASSSPSRARRACACCASRAWVSPRPSPARFRGSNHVRYEGFPVRCA